MKLTEEDKTCLRSLEVPETDWPQIEAVAGKTVYYYAERGQALLNRGQRISRAKAVELLGRAWFLSGLARSAFHWTAIRYTSDGDKIFFDSSEFFR